MRDKHYFYYTYYNGTTKSPGWGVVETYEPTFSISDVMVDNWEEMNNSIQVMSYYEITKEEMDRLLELHNDLIKSR